MSKADNYTAVLRTDGYVEITMPGMTYVIEKSKADQLAGNILRATRAQDRWEVRESFDWDLLSRYISSVV